MVLIFCPETGKIAMFTNSQKYILNFVSIICGIFPYTQGGQILRKAFRLKIYKGICIGILIVLFIVLGVYVFCCNPTFLLSLPMRQVIYESYNCWINIFEESNKDICQILNIQFIVCPLSPFLIYKYYMKIF